MKRAYAFFAVCLGAIAAVLVVVWLAGGFQKTTLDANVTLALVLGILFTCLLGVGLMALIFYSNRSGQDDEAYHSAELSDSPPDETSNGHASDAEKSIPPGKDNG